MSDNAIYLDIDDLTTSKTSSGIQVIEAKKGAKYYKRAASGGGFKAAGRVSEADIQRQQEAKRQAEAEAQRQAEIKAEQQRQAQQKQQDFQQKRTLATRFKEQVATARQKYGPTAQFQRGRQTFTNVRQVGSQALERQTKKPFKVSVKPGYSRFISPLGSVPIQYGEPVENIAYRKATGKNLPGYIIASSDVAQANLMKGSTGEKALGLLYPSTQGELVRDVSIGAGVTGAPSIVRSGVSIYSGVTGAKILDNPASTTEEKIVGGVLLAGGVTGMTFESAPFLKGKIASLTGAKGLTTKPRPPGKISEKLFPKETQTFQDVKVKGGETIDISIIPGGKYAYGFSQAEQKAQVGKVGTLTSSARNLIDNLFDPRTQKLGDTRGSVVVGPGENNMGLFFTGIADETKLVNRILNVPGAKKSSTPSQTSSAILQEASLNSKIGTLKTDKGPGKLKVQDEKSISIVGARETRLGLAGNPFKRPPIDSKLGFFGEKPQIVFERKTIIKNTGYKTSSELETTKGPGSVFFTEPRGRGVLKGQQVNFEEIVGQGKRSQAPSGTKIVTQSQMDRISQKTTPKINPTASVGGTFTTKFVTTGIGGETVTPPRIKTAKSYSSGIINRPTTVTVIDRAPPRRPPTFRGGSAGSPPPTITGPPPSPPLSPPSIPRTPPTPPRTPTIPRAPTTSITPTLARKKKKKPFFLDEPKQKKGSKEFTVELRRQGEFRPIGQTRSLTKAVNLGVLRAGGTLGATFRVRGAGNIRTPAGFRKPKGSNEAPNTFIEKRKYRLSKTSEISEIQKAKRRKKK